MRCERACAPVRVSLSPSLLGLVCLSWRVYIWQRKTRETSLFNYWWIFCPFSSTCAGVFLFFATREKNNKRTLNHFVLFKEDGHDFPSLSVFFFTPSCLCPHTFAFSQFLLVNYLKPSLVHVTFKMTMHLLVLCTRIVILCSSWVLWSETDGF